MWDIAHELSNLDNLGITVTNKQDEEKEALDNFQSNASQDPQTNVYMVGFPWIGSEIPSPNELDSNKDIVKTRFLQTMSTLDKNPKTLKDYAKVHEQEFSNGFIEKVPLVELRDPSVFQHYITHFPVIEDVEGCTTKVRRVFDTSIHKNGKAALDDLMAKGSQLTPLMLSADISKAFLTMYL